MSPHRRYALGHLIRDQRQILGLSSSALARAAGVQPSTITRLEKGEVERLDPAVLHRIARILQADLEDYYVLAGSPIPRGLPSLQPYLRATTELSDEQIRQIQTLIENQMSSRQRSREGVPNDQDTDSTARYRADEATDL